MSKTEINDLMREFSTHSSAIKDLSDSVSGASFCGIFSHDPDKIGMAYHGTFNDCMVIICHFLDYLCETEKIEMHDLLKAIEMTTAKRDRSWEDILKSMEWPDN